MLNGSITPRHNTFQRLTSGLPKNGRATGVAIKAAPTESELPGGSDKVTLASGSNRNQRVLGTALAGTGALVGRFGVVGGLAAAGATVGGVLGPVGSVVGGVVGAGAGAFVEFRDKYFKGISIKGKHLPIGRMTGGAVGGVVGSILGRALDNIPFKKPKLGSEAFDQQTKDFSLKKLAKNLNRVNHTSTPTMDAAGKTQEIVDLLQPGDVIMTNNDVWMDFEIPLRAVGSGGEWTHTALYDGEGQSLEALGSRGVVSRPVEELVGENHHVRVLRPDYPEGGVEVAINEAASHVGKPYDAKFSMKSDDALYCIEHTQKSLAKGAPEIDLKPKKLFFDKMGPALVTPSTFEKAQGNGLDVVYDTGSGFVANYMAKFS